MPPMNIRQFVRNSPGYLLRGTLTTVPLALTLYILYWLFHAVDQLLPIGIPGLGLLVTLVLVLLVGYFSSNMLGRSVLEATERGFKRVPFVNLVYSSIRDLVNAFVGDKRSFDKPVLFRFSPDAEVKALGFVTRDGIAGLHLPSHVAVYVPQSYNFAGNLLLLPRELVQPLDVPSGEVMTFIVSGGVSGFGVGRPLLLPPPAGITSGAHSPDSPDDPPATGNPANPR